MQERNVRVPTSGEGGELPPRSPFPVAIATPVQCTGRSGGGAGPGLALPPSPGKPPPAPPPGTAYPRISPRTTPAPTRGRGRRPKAGRGMPEKRMGIPRRGWEMPERNAHPARAGAESSVAPPAIRNRCVTSPPAQDHRRGFPRGRPSRSRRREEEPWLSLPWRRAARCLSLRSCRAGARRRCGRP